MTRLVDIMCLKKSLHMGRADLVPKSLNRQHITAPNFVRYFHHLQFIRILTQYSRSDTRNSAGSVYMQKR